MIRTIPVPGADGQRVTAVGRIASRDYLALGFEDGRAAVLLGASPRRLRRRRDGPRRSTSRLAGQAQVLPPGTAGPSGRRRAGGVGQPDSRLHGRGRPRRGEAARRRKRTRCPGPSPRRPRVEDLSARLAGAAGDRDRRRRDGPGSRGRDGRRDRSFRMSVDTRRRPITPARARRPSSREDPSPVTAVDLSSRRPVRRLRRREGPGLVVVSRAVAGEPEPAPVPKDPRLRPDAGGRHGDRYLDTQQGLRDRRREGRHLAAPQHVGPDAAALLRAAAAPAVAARALGPRATASTSFPRTGASSTWSIVEPSSRNDAEDPLRQGLVRGLRPAGVLLAVDRRRPTTSSPSSR